jgi:hypothetical protein
MYLMCRHVICNTATYAVRSTVDATHGTAFWGVRPGHAALNFVSYFGEILNNTIKHNMQCLPILKNRNSATGFI